MLHLPSCHMPSYVIICHGLFSSKESKKYLAIAERFTREGLAVIRFDFSGCGESSGSISETTVSRRLQELEEVAGFASCHPELGDKFGLLGSSLGGFICLVFASRHPVQAISVWATPYDLEEAGKNMPKEKLAVLRQEFFADAEKYSLSSVLSKTGVVQVIHGKKDAIVPWQHSKEIFSRVQEPKELEIFPEGDHAMSGYDERDRAITVSLDWFKKNLIFFQKERFKKNV